MRKLLLLLVVSTVLGFPARLQAQAATDQASQSKNWGISDVLDLLTRILERTMKGVPNAEILAIADDKGEIIRTQQIKILVKDVQKNTRFLLFVNTKSVGTDALLGYQLLQTNEGQELLVTDQNGDGRLEEIALWKSGKVVCNETSNPECRKACANALDRLAELFPVQFVEWYDPAVIKEFVRSLPGSKDPRVRPLKSEKLEVGTKGFLLKLQELEVVVIVKYENNTNPVGVHISWTGNFQRKRGQLGIWDLNLDGIPEVVEANLIEPELLVFKWEAVDPPTKVETDKYVALVRAVLEETR